MDSPLRFKHQSSGAIVLFWSFFVEYSIEILVEISDEFKLGSIEGTDLGSCLLKMRYFLDLGNDEGREESEVMDRLSYDGILEFYWKKTVVGIIL